MKSNKEHETHDQTTIYNDKTEWLCYDKKDLHISMEIIKIYDKVSNKWQDWIEMLQRSSRNQFIKEIIISIISIDKDNQIKEALRRLHEDREKWICEK